MPDLELKTIEGKARRRQHYPRMFFWYLPVLCVGWIGVALYYLDWDWGTVLFVGWPFLWLGVIIGVRFRDVP